MSVVKTVYTIGYGGRKLAEFFKLLELYRIKVIIDVRRWTISRKIPEFSSVNLARVLSEHGYEYYWIPELGGYRRFNIDVKDYGVAGCFKSEGFRAYATYITMKPEIKPHLEKLVKIVSSKTTTLICRERIPWLCHRKILSDYLVARGFRVLHVIEEDQVVEHKLSKCAQVINGELKYY